MKERPIIFSGPMVRAILDGRKTQTRRIAKIPLDAKSAFYDDECDSHCWSMDDDGMADPHAKMLRNPYGEFRDRLWVREKWAYVPATAYRCSEGVWQTICANDPDMAAVYAAGWERSRPSRWRPSIFMPRWASRIELEITHVRVERLQDITEEDAQAEGCEREFKADGSKGWGAGLVEAVENYRTLWNLINGPGSWDLNPWVWVIQFKRVT